MWTCHAARISSSASLHEKPHSYSSEAKFVKSQTERLIRQLNLFPKLDVNIAPADHHYSSKLVERRFRFPGVLPESPGTSVEDLGQHAGYYRLPNTNSARMFYFFFESRRNQTDDPVVSNIIYVDQPTGTGFSYTNHDDDIRSNGEDVSNDLYDFLQGFAIGNGLTQPAIQYKAYPDYALQMKLIKQSDHDELKELVPQCEEAAQECGNYLNLSPKYYDVRKQCEGRLCYDFSGAETFLNKDSVREALGVGDIEYVSCSSEVYQALLADFMRNWEVVIPPLLEDGIRFLAYVGEYDLICNWLGNARWIQAMKWSGQKDYGASRSVGFVVDGKEAGVSNSYGPLTFLKVHDAGHLVPMDQPKASLEMLQRWIQGNLTAPGQVEKLLS
ncbi:Peptidase S10, serine carboxypeptidase [Dillenia turbinata]|uniref:Peptidase S10, serine carboxypeptidase n=1 Tax=Dillenia turbinata TaxID=194707 RepID=A0AAN8ZAS4_9MAGN